MISAPVLAIIKNLTFRLQYNKTLGLGELMLPNWGLDVAYRSCSIMYLATVHWLLRISCTPMTLPYYLEACKHVKKSIFVDDTTILGKPDVTLYEFGLTQMQYVDLRSEIPNTYIVICTVLLCYIKGYFS